MRCEGESLVEHITSWTAVMRGLMLSLPGKEPNVTSRQQEIAIDNDKSIVADLDTQYQKAVKEGDAPTLDRILADDFVLITGRGKTFSKEDLLQEARAGKLIYERQEEIEQTVRVWGHAAVVTALLWAKGTDEGKPFEYKLWFSDTYVRTPIGWRYVLGQASLPLPKEV